MVLIKSANVQRKQIMLQKKYYNTYIIYLISGIYIFFETWSIS